MIVFVNLKNNKVITKEILEGNLYLKIDEEKATVTSVALKNDILLIGSKIRGLFGIRACTEVYKIKK